MRRFVDRSAIVTAAGAGIGRATALRLAAEGAAVVVTDVDEEAARAVVAEVEAAGGRAVPLRVDVAVPAEVAAMVDRCREAFGTVDVLANNAGVAVPGSVTEMSDDDWERVFAVNLGGMRLAMRAAIPHMVAQGRGAVVNMSSGQAFLGFPGWAGYAATKGAVVALTQQVAVEYARAGVRVNAVAPGTIMTPMNERIFATAPDPDALVRAWGEMHALGRFGQAEEVASAIAFLASDDASFITGVTLPVDGGMRILGPATASS